MAEEEGNSFSTRDKFPNPTQLFGFKLESIDSIKGDCVFVLDTNVLLLPFTTKSKSLEAIKAVYEKLTEEDRIFIPTHVAREFLDNRSQKLADIAQTLATKASKSFDVVGISYPLLSELHSYREIEKHEKKIKEHIKGYQQSINETLAEVKSWTWNDPVSLIYQELFHAKILNDPELSYEKLTIELERRGKLKLPPGYKDKSKKENSAGDLMIWLQILSLGERKKQHLVFISGDEKPDWWQQSGGQKLYPRIELVEEYRLKSEGKSFHIVDLSEFLELFDAPNETIDDVKASEQDNRIRSSDYDKNELSYRTTKLINDIKSAISIYRRKYDYITLSDRTPARFDRENILNPLSIEQMTERITRFSEEITAEYRTKWMAEVIAVREKILTLLPENTVKNRLTLDSIYLLPGDIKTLNLIVRDIKFLQSML